MYGGSIYDKAVDRQYLIAAKYEENIFPAKNSTIGFLFCIRTVKN